MGAVPRDHRFEVRRQLGEGSMGAVWLALDRTRGSEVALKVLAEGLRSDSRAEPLFRTEFQTLKRLSHPRIVEAYDYGTLDDGSPFFTMEWLPGPGLEEQVPLGAPLARERLAEALQGLSYLHGRGYVHGDIKPENLRCAADGKLKLVDLGLAMRVGEALSAVRGTPRYLSPEVIRGDRLDARSDLYSLGAVFYHALCGMPPFQAEGGTDLFRAHLFEMPIHLSSRGTGVPGDLAGIVMSLLAKSPADRPVSAGRVLEDLGISAHDPTRGLLVPGFVGRQIELARLEAVFEEAAAETGGQARPRVMYLYGPPGSGKSRTLEELRSRAQVAGQQVLWAKALGIMPRPYGIFFALADQLAAAIGQALPPDLELAGGGGLADPRTAQVRAQAAWARVFASATTAAGGLAWLLLDDWDAVDEPSADLLAALLRRRGVPLVIVAAGTAPDGPGKLLELTPLSLTDIEQLAAQALGAVRRGPLPALERLPAARPGNPRSTGALRPAESPRWPLADGERGHGSLPPASSPSSPRTRPSGPDRLPRSR